jgi:hypothetical protein
MWRSDGSVQESRICQEGMMMIVLKHSKALG